MALTHSHSHGPVPGSLYLSRRHPEKADTPVSLLRARPAGSGAGRPRSPGTDEGGRPFDERTRRLVWGRADRVPGWDEREWRQDRLGRRIRFSAYGDATSAYGWEIDHVLPVSKGGTDRPFNLQPLHWKTNREKGETYPWPRS